MSMAPPPPAPGDYIIKDSGQRQEFDGGMVRDTAEGKTNFLSVRFGPMLRRWADHLTAGRAKYPDPEPGVPNWTLAQGAAEFLRAKESAARHFEQWLAGDRDEDHAAGVFFNINLAEYVLERAAGFNGGMGIDPGLGATAEPMIGTQKPRPDDTARKAEAAKQLSKFMDYSDEPTTEADIPLEMRPRIFVGPRADIPAEKPSANSSEGYPPCNGACLDCVLHPLTGGRMTPIHTVVLDWDGTLVPRAWPDRPTGFMPGAVQACFAMHRAGFHLIVASARINPYNPFTSQRRPDAEVEIETRYIRDTLDSAGLTFVDIWTLPGKASGSVYIDDRAIRYTGRPGSWKAVTEKTFALLGEEEPVFPAFTQATAEEVAEKA